MSVRAAEPPSKFAELYTAYYPRLAAELGLVCADRAEGDDAAQEAFVRLLERWHRVSTYEDPAAWVRHVGYNLARDRARRRSSETKKAGRWHQLIGRSTTAPRHDTYPSLDRRDPLTDALRTLPTAQREVIVLQAVHDLNTQQIADLLNVPVGTVKSRLSRARTSLAQHFEGADHD